MDCDGGGEVARESKGVFLCTQDVISTKNEEKRVERLERLMSRQEMTAC